MENDDIGVGTATGKESSLSNYIGPYVTDMLGKATALSDEGYNAYTGPLTAGASDLETASFEGLGSLADGFTGGMGTEGFTPQDFTAENINQYMNPYLMNALNPQIDEARRQSEIDRVNNASRMTKAGSFGGSRQAVFDAENQGNLQRNLAGITGQGYADAYNTALNQYNTTQDRNANLQGLKNEYGLTGIGALADLGGVQRTIEGEGIAADKSQFEEERDFPYKKLQYLSSLLQGLPTAAQSYDYKEPSYLNKLASDAGDFESFFKGLFNTGFAPAEKTSAEETVESEGT